LALGPSASVRRFAALPPDPLTAGRAGKAGAEAEPRHQNTLRIAGAGRDSDQGVPPLSASALSATSRSMRVAAPRPRQAPASSKRRPRRR